jgi:hypothetical protein
MSGQGVSIVDQRRVSLTHMCADVLERLEIPGCQLGLSPPALRADVDMSTKQVMKGKRNEPPSLATLPREVLAAIVSYVKPVWTLFTVNKAISSAAMAEAERDVVLNSPKGVLRYERHLRARPEAGPRCRSLKMAIGAPPMTSEMLVILLPWITDLRSLEASADIGPFAPLCFEHLGRMPHLVKLLLHLSEDLAKCLAHDLLDDRFRAPHLRTLCLTGLSPVNDDADDHDDALNLTNASSISTWAPALTHLFLDDVVFAEGADLVALLRNLTTLRNLGLYSINVDLTGEEMAEALRTRRDTLHRLNLSNVPSTTSQHGWLDNAIDGFTALLACVMLPPSLGETPSVRTASSSSRPRNHRRSALRASFGYRSRSSRSDFTPVRSFPSTISPLCSLSGLSLGCAMRRWLQSITARRPV